MKIVFFATSDFALPALDALLASQHQLLAVVTAPDRKQGRGQKLAFSPVKLFAQSKGLPIWQPHNLGDPEFLSLLGKKSADLFVVASYGKILTKEILKLPQKYCLNLHASLLPKYRGAAPINWAIINGEKLTGVTIFKMNEYMDRGEIILQAKIAISDEDTSISLSRQLSKIAAKALLSTLDLIERGAVTFTAQNESAASLAPKLSKQDGLINWKSAAREIQNRIRGVQPWPGTFTYLQNKLLKIWSSQVLSGAQQGKPGEIIQVDEKKGILVQTGKDQLLITELQLAGRNKMSAAEFIIGHKIKIGEKLAAK